MTLKTLTTTLLLATSFLLLTGCNDTSKTDTKTIVNPDSLTITISKTTLNKDENTTVEIIAKYKGGVTREVTDKVEWIVTPEDAVTVIEKILIAKKDTPTTLNAKLGTTLSNTVNLNIVWIVNGHTLPPEPDKTVNDSTLLGIDVNGNGVRDDVERWIYITYKDKHPIHVDIAMQAGRAKQKMLEDPSKAKEIHDEMSAPIDCESYYRVCVKEPNKKIHIRERINSKLLRSIIFNTKKRKDAYMEYNSLLSGDTYVIPWCSERKQLCDFDTNKYEE